MRKENPQPIPTPWLTHQDLPGPFDTFIPLSLETSEIETSLSLELVHSHKFIPEEIG